MKKTTKQNLTFTLVLGLTVIIVNLSHCNITHANVASLSLNELTKISTCQAEAIDSTKYKYYSPQRTPIIGKELTEEEKARIEFFR